MMRVLNPLPERADVCDGAWNEHKVGRPATDDLRRPPASNRFATGIASLVVGAALATG